MSNTTGCGSINTQLYTFTTNDAGKTTGTAFGNMPLGGTNGLLPSQVSINGTTDLSQIILGNNNGCVTSIVYEHFDGIARSSVISVYGQGPKGIGSGSIDMTFVTSEDTHTLSLTSSSPACHTDKFQDPNNITKITWAPS